GVAARHADRARSLRRGLRAPAASQRGPGATLRDRGTRLLMRRAAVAALLGLLLIPGASSAAPLLDALVGVVDGRTVSVSDVALARALGVLGFQPSSAPITHEDVERFADARLLLDEAGRIGIAAEPAEIDRAWAAVVARVGSDGTLDRWLDSQNID